MSACQTETPAPQIVLVTGASSGFGRLVANAMGAGKRGCAPVARSGHTVYAAMHETTGRNAPTHILANEMRGKNITVNAIAPGPTATHLFLDGKPQGVIDHLSHLAPLERLGTPGDIAAAVSFLAGSDGSWINGQVLRANGGIV